MVCTLHRIHISFSRFFKIPIWAILRWKSWCNQEGHNHDHTTGCSCNSSIGCWCINDRFGARTYERFHDGIFCKCCNGKQIGKYFKLCNEHQLIRAYTMRHYLRNVRTGLEFTTPVLAIYNSIFIILIFLNALIEFLIQ